jgi:uncharacterized membrane protein
MLSVFIAAFDLLNFLPPSSNIVSNDISMYKSFESLFFGVVAVLCEFYTD